MKNIAIRRSAILALSHVLLAGFLNFGTINNAFAFDQPWNGGREDITRPEEDEEEECEGNECACPDETNTSSPVYSARGYLVWSDLDIEFPTDTQIGLSRTYNSFDFRAGLFGRGWVTDQESNIARTYKAVTEGNADGSSKPADTYESVPIWLASYGRRYKLEETELGCQTPDILYFTFEKTEDGGFKQVFENSQSYVIYNSQGLMLSSFSDRHGSSVYYEYNDENRLVRQFDSYGFSLEFFYNDQGFVSDVVDQSDRQWHYSYDEFGRLTQVIDPDGNSKDYGYQLVDKTGYKQHLLNSVDDNGTLPALDVTYSEVTLYGKSAMRVKSYVARDGHRHEYVYSQVTHLGKPAVKVVKTTKQVNSTFTLETHEIITDPETYQIISSKNLGKQTVVSRLYNEKGRVTELTDSRGNKTIHEFDELNRKVGETNLAGTDKEKLKSWTYFGNTDLVEVATEFGVLETRHSYDSNLRLTSSTQKDLVSGVQRVWSYAYYPDSVDALGNLLRGRLKSIDGPKAGTSDTTTFVYTPNGLLERKEYPGGLFKSYEYNASGQVKKVTDFNGIETDVFYDSKNRVVRIERADGDRGYEYTPRGQLKSFTDEAGRTTVFEYNSQGYVTKITYPDQHFETFEYNYTNLYAETVHTEFNASGVAVGKDITRFDAVTKVQKEVYLASATAAQKVSENQFNENNELVTRTRYGTFNGGTETSSVTTYSYDSEGRLETINDAIGGITTFGYDDFGRVTSSIAANSTTTELQLNAWGQTLMENSADSGTTILEYDPAGSVSKRTDANGAITNFVYDELNRISLIDYPTEPDTVFVYDEGSNGKGRLTSVTDASGTTEISYDSEGSITGAIAVVHGASFSTSFGYNISGQIEEITYPSGIKSVLRYDAAGRSEAIDLQQNDIVFPIIKSIVWSGSRVASDTFGNDKVATYNYDASGRLTGKQYGGQSEKFVNQLDQQGNVVQQTWTRANAAVINQFRYDKLGRLTFDGSAGGGMTITYDAAGNRQSALTSNASVGYEYTPSSNRLATVGGVAQQHDSNGNTLSNGDASFGYAQHNRRVSATIGGDQVSYSYNYKGERVRKLNVGTSSSDIRYVYGQFGELLGEYDAQGTRIREILYRYDLSTAEPVAQIDAAGNIVYVHTDHLYTPRLATDQQGVVVWRWISDAFGDGAPREDEDGDGINTVINLRLPGQIYDSETGHHYNYFRYYDPSVGRYYELDPLGALSSLNSYVYASSRPLSIHDSFGLAWGNARATWQFYFGGGRTVSLSETGHVGTVTNQVQPRMNDWKNKTESAARSLASSMPCNSGSSMYLSDSVGAHSGVWWIGGISLSRASDCTVDTKCKKNNPCPILDKKKYSFSCALTFGMHDIFENPSDLDNSAGTPNADVWDEWQYGGTPFFVDHTWSQSVSGSGEI